MGIKELVGEATEYDKKQALEAKRPKSWLKSVSAFANSFGGKLIFGISDDDEVTGLEDAKGDAEIISETIKTRMNPIPKFRLSFETVDDKDLIVVEVMSGDETPYYYFGEGQLVAFVRLGNESVLANPAQLRELVIRGSGQSYDSLPSRFRFEDMAFTKLRSVYKQRTGESFEDTDFESFGIVDSNGSLTNAGALLADESPVRHSRVFCTRWNGLSKASGLMDAVDDEEYSGSLVSLFQDGIGFIMRHNKKAWRKAATRRIEYPDYPERAITEGLVNALIHRNYMEIGSEVHIDIFDDRLEIYSPGGMVDGSSLKGRDLRTVSSKRRNPVLADIFSRLQLMERRGSGFKKILEDYDFQENAREELMPKFVADNGDFLLTLYNLNYYERQDGGKGSEKFGEKPEKMWEMPEKMWEMPLKFGEMLGENPEIFWRKFGENSEKVRRKFGESDEKSSEKGKKSSEKSVKSSEKRKKGSENGTRQEMLRLIQEDNKISAASIAEKMDISSRAVEKNIKILREQGTLRRHGSARGGYWEIVR